MTHSTIHPSEEPIADPSEHAPEHSSPGLRVYYVVYAALLVLLVLTIAVASIDLGAMNLTVALIIAAIKAVLVLLYFMHLRYASRLTWLFAGAGFVWLFIMLLYTITDYLSRGWVVSF